MQKSTLTAITCFLFCMLFSIHSRAAEGDTTMVNVHNAVDMTWYGNYDRIGVFPNDANKTYRKILMKYTMGCATGGCSDWDYTTRILLMNPSGMMDSTVTNLDTISTNPLVVDTTWNVFEVMTPFELGRVITPYGGNLPNSWTREFIFDVTDYVHLLKDSTQIRAHYSGWSSGFSVTLDFMFIEGTPPRDVIGVHSLYRGSKNYSSSADFESTYFTSKDIDIESSTIGARIFSTITGHGFDNNVNCAEFCPRDYDMKVNGSVVGSHTIWNDECGSNPLYPQAGTWLLDRAGWCPGDKGDIHEQEVTVNVGTSNTVEFDMESYTWSGTQTPSYTVDAHLVTYGSPNFNTDVSILNIHAPSDEFEYSRINPICGEPIIEIQNTGANTVTSINFDYGVIGGNTCSHTWTGSLDFLEKAEITLPAINWSGLASSSNLKFEVYVTGVNGTTDEYSQNDRLESNFDLPNLMMFDSLIVKLSTNLANETSYQIKDIDGNVIHERSTASISTSSTYTDVVQFTPGCYTISVQDNGGDGLSYWANNDGSGSLTLNRDVPNVGLIPIIGFTDFGNFIEYSFVIGSSQTQIGEGQSTTCFLSDVAKTESKALASYHFYPNPNTGAFSLELDLDQTQDVNCTIYNSLGNKVHTEHFNSIQAGILDFDLDVPTGIYFLRVDNGNENLLTHKFIIQK
ncbi:MAG: T9SS type A sorting domain-containing protein [Saprospiraceae bacterium]|nr:T9SS type A sorting domain-containing protein [Saprospiraceae bacterium]